MIRIVIADDHTIVREGLKQLLAAAGDFEIVGEVQDGHEAMRQVRSLDFDVLLMDMSMPGKGGMELIKQVKSEKPKVRILVLTMHEEHQYAVRAIRAGASGYLTKDGATYISSAVAEQLALHAMPGAEGPPHAALSNREFQVFSMIAEGKSVSDIAERLNLSVKTVSTHKANLMQKMNMSTTGEIIRYAIAHKLVEAPGG